MHVNSKSCTCDNALLCLSLPFVSQRARERHASASSSLPDSSQPSTSGVSHLTPHTHSTPPHPSHPASSTTASEDPSSSNDRESTPPLEPESAYESAGSLVPEAGPSHTPQSVGSRGEGGSHAPHTAGEGRQSGEGAGRGGMDEDDTQPLDLTPTREEPSHGTRTQSSIRCALYIYYTVHVLALLKPFGICVMLCFVLYVTLSLTL